MSDAHTWILELAKERKDLKILELGTKRWKKELPTHRKKLIDSLGIQYEEYIMSDFIDGDDVDVVADAHTLSTTFNRHYFDLILGYSIFEHLEKPWIVSAEINKILKPDGLFFFQTHHTFPVHGYPSDYFRYTTEGLKSLFDWAKETRADYKFPSLIITCDKDVYVSRVNSFLNSNIGGIK